jgi:hypothetical protein
MWSTTNHIFARRVTSMGALETSYFAVTQGTNSRRSPAVAFNGLNDEYLVVYMYDASGDGVHWEVWGQLVTWNGDVGDPFQIFTWANRAFYDPRVAWSSIHNQYLVVANALDTTTYKWNDVVGKRVSANGSVIAGGSISSQSQSFQPCEADVAYNVAADEYLVVWRRMATDTDGDIWRARVRGDNGAVVPPGEDDLIDDDKDQAHPAVATNGQDRYLVVWQNGSSTWPTTDWNIYGYELDLSGWQADPYHYSYAYSTDSEYLADVVMNWATGERFVVYRRIFPSDHEEIWGSMWTPWGGMKRFQIAPNAASYEDSPVVAAGNPGYLIVYDKHVSGIRNIYARLYGLPAVYLPTILGQ